MCVVVKVLQHGVHLGVSPTFGILKHTCPEVRPMRRQRYLFIQHNYVTELKQMPSNNGSTLRLPEVLDVNISPQKHCNDGQDKYRRRSDAHVPLSRCVCLE